MRIALAIFALVVVKLASSEAIHNNDNQDLTNDYARGSSSNAVIRQRRSPVPAPPKKKKPFKVQG